jgi:5-methylcytosine-specific restriction protein A
MPRRAPRPCSHPLCGALTEDGWCTVHRKAKDQRDRETRGTAAERGYGPRWATYSRAYRKAHPVCMICLENPSRRVDHIIPVEGPTDRRFWDSKNHQALCPGCDAIKTRVTQPHGRVNTIQGRVRKVVQPTAVGGWFR